MIMMNILFIANWLVAILMAFMSFSNKSIDLWAVGRGGEGPTQLLMRMVMRYGVERFHFRADIALELITIVLCEDTKLKLINLFFDAKHASDVLVENEEWVSGFSLPARCGWFIRNYEIIQLA